MNKEYSLCLVYPLVPPLQVDTAFPNLQRILRFRGDRPISHKENDLKSHTTVTVLSGIHLSEKL